MGIGSDHVTRAASTGELIGAKLRGHHCECIMRLLRLLSAVDRQRVLLGDGGLRSGFQDRRIRGTGRCSRLKGQGMLFLLQLADLYFYRVDAGGRVRREGIAEGIRC